MNIIKSFDKWVAKNFRGLSAFTLCQFLKMLGYSVDCADETVYVDLYKVFTKQATDKENDAFTILQVEVENCEWL